jgi:hypothetical protein
MPRLSTLLAAGAAVIAACVAVVGIASATTPDATGAIHACFSNKSGAVRVTDPALKLAACKNNESPLVWQTGTLPHNIDDSSKTVALPLNNWVDLVSFNFTLTANSDVWLDATVNAQGPPDDQTLLQLRVLEDGEPEGEPTSATLAANAFASVPTGLLKCNGMTAGTHTFTLQALATTTGASVVHSTLSSLALPPGA